MRVVILLLSVSLMGMGSAPPLECVTHLNESEGTFGDCIIAHYNIERGANEWHFKNYYKKPPVCVCTVQAGLGVDRVCQTQSTTTTVTTYATIEGDGSPEILSLMCKEAE